DHDRLTAAQHSGAGAGVGGHAERHRVVLRALERRHGVAPDQAGEHELPLEHTEHLADDLLGLDERVRHGWNLLWFMDVDRGRPPWWGPSGLEPRDGLGELRRGRLCGLRGRVAPAAQVLPGLARSGLPVALPAVAGGEGLEQL